MTMKMGLVEGGSRFSSPGVAGTALMQTTISLLPRRRMSGCSLRGCPTSGGASLKLFRSLYNMSGPWFYLPRGKIISWLTWIKAMWRVSFEVCGQGQAAPGLLDQLGQGRNNAKLFSESEEMLRQRLWHPRLARGLVREGSGT